jgi:hypothetical protein
MPRQIGASSRATRQSNRVGSSLELVAGDVRTIHETQAHAETPGSIAATLDPDPRSADQAARAIAFCGVRREDAVWVTECAWCKRVRGVGGDWQTLAPAVRAVMNIERTHGVCPQCAQGLVARAESADREAG